MDWEWKVFQTQKKMKLIGILINGAMNRINAFSFFTIAILLVVSCSKYPQEQFVTKTLELGFEDQTSVDDQETDSPDTKIYLKNNSTVAWSTATTGAGDFHIQVFDSDNVVHRFDAIGPDPKTVYDKKGNPLTQVGAANIRSFSCTEWPAPNNTPKALKLVVWTSKKANGDLSLDNDLIVKGGGTSSSSLYLKSEQAPNMTHSFDNAVNFSVKKPEDSQLLSSVGFLRLDIPAFKAGTADEDKSCAGLKTVKITANEFIAGPVKIDCSGTKPKAIVDDEALDAYKSKSITLTVRAKSNVYETGYIYITMPPGTYTGVSLELTPFTAKNTTTGDPFTINLKGEVVIHRAKWTAVKKLPASKPS